MSKVYSADVPSQDNGHRPMHPVGDSAWGEQGDKLRILCA